MAATTSLPVLPRAPLVLVLAQLRFTPILKINELVPEIQDQLRKSGFPQLVNREVKTVTYEGQQAIKTEVLAQWEFVNKDASRSIILDQASVCFMASEYSHFVDFLAWFRPFLEPSISALSYSSLRDSGFAT